ncbi:Retrovirus-related Pol polyprotein from transposon RE1 [Vitis vinifera]|uniref:Retrovirus-related Pol polyprotein from transposon RE1 n=1 Tax=Vitis vinifera TaxID=29760 RepID=A0A438CP88_VITVI|nr:Retrovirus-related Pol polyprotein from transposon RE1 [Vitis vinifera]
MAFSSSASSNVIFAPPNIGHLVSIKLSDTNYLIWSSQIVPVLKSHDLMGFVDGSEPCPSKSLDASVYGITSAREVWSSLANKFASQSRTRVHHLKRKLQTLHQGSMKCTDFLEKVKLVSDELAAVGKPLEDDDLMSYIVSGLNPSFNPFITSLSFATRDKNVSFEDFPAELLSYELLLENQNIAIPPETNNFAFFTPKSNQQQYNRKPKNPSKPYSRPSFSQNPRPRYSPQPSGLPSSPQPNQKQHSFSTPKSPCQICGKLSHKALDCFHRMDYAYQGRHPPTQLAAMVAHSNAEQEEETWFADSGANQHITANLEHLTLQQPYIGQENVAVGNGQGLSIAHTGTTIFHTPEAKLNLKRVLHCPQASANLLSINQFCLDNNCLFILTDYVCKLNKSLYGLKQAPRAWFMRLSQILLEFGFLSSPVDASLFVYHKGHIHLFILIYVDDILVTGTDPSLIQSLIQKLQTEFKMKDLGPLGYFLGIQASRDSSGLHLRQSKYIGDLLHRTKMAGAKPASSPCITGLKLSTHVALQFIGSYDQPADIFTKGLSLARFCLLRDKLMVVSLPISLRGDDNHNIQTTEISLASHLSYPPDKHLSTLRDNP